MSQTPDDLLDDIIETWRNAPTRLEIKTPDGTDCESMAWKRVLSDDEKARMQAWAEQKYVKKVILVWSVGADV